MPSSDLGHIPGPVVIPGCIQVALKWSTPFGRQALNIMHGSVLGGFTPTPAIANAIHAGLGGGGAWDALAAFLAGGSFFEGVRLLDMRTAGEPPVDSTDAAVPGTSGVAAMAPSTSLVITQRTARAGPGFRGRIYVPCWAVNATTAGGVVATAARDALQAWANTIPGVLAANGLTLALGLPARAAYTGESGTPHAARAATTQAVTSMVVRNTFWDAQRRRGEPS